MAFDNSANFVFTGATELWVKEKGISSVYFIAQGAGGGGGGGVGAVAGLMCLPIILP